MPETPTSSHRLARRAINKIWLDAFALQYGLNRRTAERIYSGAKPCPPGIIERLRAQLQARP